MKVKIVPVRWPVPRVLIRESLEFRREELASSQPVGTALGQVDRLFARQGWTIVFVEDYRAVQNALTRLYYGEVEDPVVEVRVCNLGRLN